MAARRGPSPDSPLLGGLFGVFQRAADQQLTTAQVWSSLRQAAGTWAWRTEGRGPLPDPATLEARGAEVLRSQGVGIREVNRYRGIAGSWRRARDTLHDLGETDQITGRNIFTPPWAVSGDAGAPARFRIRVNWQVETNAGQIMNTWGTYELEGPLTSVSDALNQAAQLVNKKPTSDTPLGADVTDIVDYQIEQI